MTEPTSLTGIKISVADYNNYQTAVASVLGTGSGNSGWGQTTISSPVSVSSRITVNEWANLKSDILRCYKHINNTVPTLIDPVVDRKVTISPNPGVGPTITSPYTSYQPFISFITANRLNIPPFREEFVGSPDSSRSQTWPGNYGPYWRETISATIEVAFTNSNRARWFFNSGGEIYIESTMTVPAGSPSNPQRSEWQSFLTSVGKRFFGGNTPQTGISPLNGQNFYRLRNTYTNPFYDQQLTGLYASSRYKIWCRSLDALNNDNSTGTASSIEFLIEWADEKLASGTDNDRIDNNTVNLFAGHRKASPPTVGALTIDGPQITISEIKPQFAPANSAFSISPSNSNVDEGSSVSFTVSTSNVAPGTTLYWKIYGGPGVDSSDFVQSSGAFLVGVNGLGSFNVQVAADYITEGAEYFIAEVRANSTLGPILVASQPITINDNTVTYAVTLPTSARNTTTDLRQLLLSLSPAWNQIARVSVIIPDTTFSGTRVVGYTKADTPVKHADVSGLTLRGSWPNGLVIQNFGQLVGAGGRGGAASTAVAGTAGSPGGPGITITSTFVSPFLDVINYAFIGGGGGGGGGGHEGSGGGGAPFGATGTGSRPGSAGGVRLGGAGGTGTNANGGQFGAGGRGGNIGLTGSPGTGNFPGNANRDNGGAPGHSIVGRGLIRLLDNIPDHGNLYGDVTLNNPSQD